MHLPRTYQRWRTNKQMLIERTVFDKMLKDIDEARLQSETDVQKRLIEVQKIDQSIRYLFQQEHTLPNTQFKSELIRLNQEYEFARGYLKDMQNQVNYCLIRAKNTNVAIQRINSARLETKLNEQWSKLGEKPTHMARQMEYNEEARAKINEISDIVRESQEKITEEEHDQIREHDEMMNEDEKIQRIKLQWKHTINNNNTTIHTKRDEQDAFENMIVEQLDDEEYIPPIKKRQTNGTIYTSV
jgi:hypothetical protein